MSTQSHAFDAALRARHQAALAGISPQVRAQLAQRRTAALRGTTARRGYGLRYAAAGFATLCALAIGLRLYPQPAPTALAPAVAIAAQPAATPPTAPSSVLLEEDPDFYAWLGSSDVRQLAME